MKFGYSDDQSEGFMSPSVDELLCQQLISSMRKHTPSRTRVQTRQDVNTSHMAMFARALAGLRKTDWCQENKVFDLYQM